MAFCMHCGATLGGSGNFCPSCGKALSPRADPSVSSAAPAAFATPTPPAGSAWAPASSPPPIVAPPPSWAHPQGQTVSEGVAIAALLLNILIWPGLGSLIAGDNRGWAQGFLFLGGLILTITIIGLILGIPMMIGAWIWGIVTAVQVMRERQVPR